MHDVPVISVIAICHAFICCFFFISGADSILKNIQREIFQFPGVLFLHILLLETFYGELSP